MGNKLWVLRLAVSNTSRLTYRFLTLRPTRCLEPSAAQTVGPDMWWL